MHADRKKVLRLLKTARGQIDGIIKMVEDDRYCVDISNQLLACGSILKKTNLTVLDGHLQSCVRDALAAGDSQEAQEKIDEILALLQKMN